MKVIFLSIGGFNSIIEHDQYPDLLRAFQNNGFEVYVVCANERKTRRSTELVEDHGVKILRVQIGNITQSGIIEKGIATVMVEYQYKFAIKKYFNDIKFDLVLYTTPPISLANVVKYLKKQKQAYAYLILKDIFPQNAVDLGMLQTSGIKGIIYRYFRNQEKKLYANSDKIGTMSEANRNYILLHNKEINPKKIEICPNCLEVQYIKISDNERIELRKKYNIPTEKIVFVYGGNLGKPQNISYVIRCIREAQKLKNIFFWIIGNGTEFSLLKDYIQEEKPINLKLSERLPKKDYDRLIASCDVGLIFLDNRFTIPNFPSRMLSYMQAGLPVLACTDKNTDIGSVIVDGQFGWWLESNNPKEFCNLLRSIKKDELKEKGTMSTLHLQDYDCKKVANNIISHLKSTKRVKSK